jgi:putative oxidoreductase
VLLITGLFTRIIAISFIIEMVVAILTTKISLYLGTSPLPLPPALPKVGFWAVMHESRSDYAQILTSTFLLVVGPGSWSLDALLRRRRDAAIAPQASEPMHSLPALGLPRRG